MCTSPSAIARPCCACCRTMRPISRSWAGRRSNSARRPNRSCACHPHVIVAPLSHPLRHAKRFDLQELAGDTFMLREPGSGTRAVAEHVFRQHLFVPSRSVTLGSNETIKQAVSGHGCEPHFAAYARARTAHGRDRLLDVNGTPIERTWQLVHSRAKQSSPACLAFRRFLLEHAEPFLEREYAPFGLRRPRTLVDAQGMR